MTAQQNLQLKRKTWLLCMMRAYPRALETWKDSRSYYWPRWKDSGGHNEGSFKEMLAARYADRYSCCTLQRCTASKRLQLIKCLMSLQKAFMTGIPECTEQSSKLATALREAHTKQRSITVCWLDLANAYGSVHHNLVQFSLQHYNAPCKLTEIVTSLYSDLQALITSPDWMTRPIPMKTGVYQGDPFSVVIFNT